ncbi:hypothetical protein ACE6H2_026540 [Prunus campanulata]
MMDSHTILHLLLLHLKILHMGSKVIRCAANPCDCLLLPTHVVAFGCWKNEFSEPDLV